MNCRFIGEILSFLEQESITNSEYASQVIIQVRENVDNQKNDKSDHDCWEKC